MQSNQYLQPVHSRLSPTLSHCQKVSGLSSLSLITSCPYLCEETDHRAMRPTSIIEGSKVWPGRETREGRGAGTLADLDPVAIDRKLTFHCVFILFRAHDAPAEPRVAENRQEDRG